MNIIEIVFQLIEEVGAGAAIRNLEIGKFATRAGRGEIRTQLTTHRKNMADIREKYGKLEKGVAPSPERVAAVATERRTTAKSLDKSVHEAKNVKSAQNFGPRTDYNAAESKSKENFIHLGNLNKKTMNTNTPKYIKGNDWGVSGKVAAKENE